MKQLVVDIVTVTAGGVVIIIMMVDRMDHIMMDRMEHIARSNSQHHHCQLYSDTYVITTSSNKLIVTKLVCTFYILSEQQQKIELQHL